MPGRHREKSNDNMSTIEKVEPTEAPKVQFALTGTTVKAKINTQVESVTEGNEIKIPLVIPLLRQNLWRKEHTFSCFTEEGNGKSKEKDRIAPEWEGKKDLSLDERAAAELLKSARGEVSIMDLSKPILCQNVIPGIENCTTERSRLAFDMKHRPDEMRVDSANYESTPVEEFGFAMLRGMGWEKGKPVGRGSFAKVIEPIQYLSRSKGLGLGATEMKLEDPTLQGKGPKERAREEQDKLRGGRLAPGPDGKVRHMRTLDEKLVPICTGELKAQSLIEIVEGRYITEFARVARIDSSSSRPVKAYLLLNEDEVSLRRDQCKVLDEYTLPADHPARGLSRKRKHDELTVGMDANGSESSQSRSSKKEARISWVVAGLKVRVNSKKLKGGKFLAKKGRVSDVTSPTTFCLVMEDERNTYLEDVREGDVETVIPKVGGKVLCVKGKHKGETGTLLERKRDRAIAVVQFGEELDVAKVGFEEVCELC